MVTKLETHVREYGKRKDYEKDAEKLGAQGWRVMSVTEARGGPRWGFVLLGLILAVLPGVLAFLFIRKTKFVVTYQREVAV